MPELPEVQALASFVDRSASGRRVESAELGSLSALKTFDPPLESLHGRELSSASRRGKYLLIAFDGGQLWMVVHLARGGWLHWRDPLPAGRARPGKGPLALRVRLSGGVGFDLTEQGTEKRLAVWVVGDPLELPVISSLGPEPLDPGFGTAQLAAALAGHSGNLKSVLRDQSVIAGIGNAYSDEILHRARMSPFKAGQGLTDDELRVLHSALVDVLTEARDRASGLPASELKSDKKSGLAVHGRAGQPCPVCGDEVRQVVYAGRSTEYCPMCQTGGRVLADRRLSRLLK